MPQLEPSFDGKLDFYNVRTAALLVLAISAPVSFERRICSIPPQIFSYAVTLLGRISCGLIDVMDKNTLLTYLSHCSRFTVVSASEFFKGEVLDFQFKDRDIQLLKKCSEISGGLLPELMELKVTTPLHNYQLNLHVKSKSCTEIVFQKVIDLWPLMQLGCQNEVIRTLRNWKAEVRQLSHDSNQPAGVLVFALEYLHVIKLLVKSWACYLSIKKFEFNAMGVLEALLGKAERRLKELLYRFTGLGREDELRILELLLVTYTLRMSYIETCFDAYMKKMNLVLSHAEHLHEEGSIELSHFVVELQNISCKVGNSKDESIHELDMLQKSLDLYSPRHFVLSGELKHMEACVDVHNNYFQNPLPFISGLPVGIPFEITLYNVSSETRLWLTMTLSESTQFVFLDLQDFGGCKETRKFTFIAPFYRTPKVRSFSLKVSIAMECLSEVQPFKHCTGPKLELVHLCKEKEVYLSIGC
ncbi:hypothetical protein ACJIZ3_019031 [Penstemon smallii]|uniref:Integrator complex subunit 4/Protein SIEL C-terminal Ig-like domain-containing protein n=1 Tax=Penstemon smallii TaxID=265156 RepID=A0ABD3T006_9LAMI